MEDRVDNLVHDLKQHLKSKESSVNIEQCFLELKAELFMKRVYYMI